MCLWNGYVRCYWDSYNKILFMGCFKIYKDSYISQDFGVKN